MFLPMKDQSTSRVDRKPRVFNVHPSCVSDPVKIMDHCHSRSGYASLGSRLYRAGGGILDCLACDEKEIELSDTEVSRKVDCWDAVTNECWELAEMNNDRSGPRLLFLKGTLFAVGPLVEDSIDYENPNLVEYYIGEENTWYTTENAPPNSVDLYNFVCGAIEEEGWLLFGSSAPPSAPAGSDGVFMILKPTYNNTGKIIGCAWSRASFGYNHMLSACCGSPPAVVDGSKMMWLDDRGTRIIGFDYKSDGGAYFCIDLASEAVLPSPRCSHYFGFSWGWGHDGLDLER